MKFNYVKNRLKDRLSMFLVVILGIAFYFILLNFYVILNAVKFVLGILTPVIYGVVIAYLLAPVCNFLDIRIRKVLSKKVKDREKIIKVSNFISTFLSFTMFVLLLVLLIALVIPQLIFTVTQMTDTIPSNIENISKLVKDMFESNYFLKSKMGNIWNNMLDYFLSFINNNVLTNLDSIISGVSVGVAQTIREISNVVIGLVISVYCLNNRKTFSVQGKKVVYAFLDEDKAKSFMKRVKFIDKAFSEFISGKLLEALAVGIVCLIGTSLIGTQYALLVSVIIGVTNIIPFFGPFIGGIPACLIILFESPIKCLYFSVFLFILIQVDGNFLGPKILSNSTGLTSFWIIFSIILFGGLFGIVGMLIGIPLFSVLYSIFRDMINERLMKKSLYVDTETSKN